MTGARTGESRPWPTIVGIDLAEAFPAYGDGGACSVVPDLIHQRIGQDNRSTTGALITNIDLPGSWPRGTAVSWLLEDKWRLKKVGGETRFPAGLHRLTKITHSGILDSMRRWWDGELPWIVGIDGVPGYSLLRVHCGNDHFDSDGCPLTGTHAMNSWRTSAAEASVAASRPAYVQLHHTVWVPLFEANPEPTMLTRDESFLLV